MAISMFTNNYKISDLWNLDVLGIQDPIECKSIKERDRELNEQFSKTVTVNSESRYEVQLPWLEAHPVLADNKPLAMLRLSSATKKLTAQGLRGAYETVFNEWLAEGVIERVPAEEEEDWDFYLPHRPVVKE